MPRFVKDSGPLEATTLVCGEAPGKDEDKRGRPFLGQAGQRLTYYTKRVGIDRLRELRITNTYPFRPPLNNLMMIPERERRRQLDLLHQKVQSMPNLKLIIPMGAHALRAFLPDLTATITNVRGSVYPCPTREAVWVMPMVHPAATLYNDEWSKVAMKDWERAQKIMRDPEVVRIPNRHHEIMPSLKRLREYAREVEALGLHDCLAADIETPIKTKRMIVGYYKKGTPKYRTIKGPRFIACIGFSAHPLHSLTVPLTRAYWGRDLAEAWDLVEAICNSRVPKVFHNGMFDVWHLRRVGIRVRNWKWDTKDLHHCLDPWDKHSLAMCASRDTWEPYWKDESGNDKGLPAAEFLTRYWIYNGKDAAVTRELKDVYEQRLLAMPVEEAA